MGLVWHKCINMKKTIIAFLLSLAATTMHAQDSQTMKFNPPYTSFNNRSVILPSDRIPNEFLGCTLGITNEVDALKNLNSLGIPFKSYPSGSSDVISISDERIGKRIECEGTRFGGISLWFYNNILWKVVFYNMRTDPKILVSTIKQKYSKFSCVNDRFRYIRYIGSSADIVLNDACLQYTISGGSCINFGE